MEEHSAAQGSDQSSASGDRQSTTAGESHTPGLRSFEREYSESTSCARSLLYGSCLSLLLAGAIAGVLAVILAR